MKPLRVVPFFGSAALAVAIVACGSIPDVTFSDDASTPAVGKDGAPAQADGNTPADLDGTPGTDGSMFGKDSGPKDSGNQADTGTCTASGNDQCCGAQLCVRCNMGNCASCTSMCTDPGKPLCCYDSQGNGLTCKPAGASCQ